MRKNLIFLCLFVFSACSSHNTLLTEENISDFQNITSVILEDNCFGILGRNLEDVSKIYARNPKGEAISVYDLYFDFVKKNPNIGSIYKSATTISLILKEENDSVNYMKSEGIKKRERGAKLLLEKIPCGNDKIRLVHFCEYTYIPLLGNTVEGKEYVYSSDLDLSSLSSDELYVFGFAYAKKTKYKDWFYTAPLG